MGRIVISYFVVCTYSKYILYDCIYIYIYQKKGFTVVVVVSGSSCSS